MNTTSNDIIKLIKGLSVGEQLKIVEDILRNIRENDASGKGNIPTKPESTLPGILALAGSFSEEEAEIFESAIAESRKIDTDEW